jgi:hypothetical protein
MITIGIMYILPIVSSALICGAPRSRGEFALEAVPECDHPTDFCAEYRFAVLPAWEGAPWKARRQRDARFLTQTTGSSAVRLHAYLARPRSSSLRRRRPSHSWSPIEPTAGRRHAGVGSLLATAPVGDRHPALAPPSTCLQLSGRSKNQSSASQYPSFSMSWSKLDLIFASPKC